MKKRVWLAGVAAAIPLLAAAAVPLLGGSAFARPTPAIETPQPGKSDWPNQERLDRAAQAVEDLGVNRYPAVYGGVEMDVPTDVLIVHRVPGSTGTEGFDAAVRDTVRPVAAPSRVVIKDAPYAQAQLYAWQETLSRDADSWRARGTVVYEIETAPGGSCVEVGVGGVDRDGALLAAHYTTIPLCFHPSGGDVPAVDGGYSTLTSG